MSAGLRLRRARMDAGLTCRDVEDLSRAFAEISRNDRLIVRISALSEIENHGQVPNIFHLNSLCVIYSLKLETVLSWYGVRGNSQKTVPRWFSSVLFRGGRGGRDVDDARA